MKNKLLVSSLFINAFLFAQVANAEHVLPVFSGSWYSHADLQYFDSCGQAAFSYSDKSQSAPNLFAQQILNNLPTHANCQWHEIQLTHAREVPLDFPGSRQDWDKLSVNAGLQSPLKAQRDCVNQDGHIIDSRVSYIYPIYTCPATARYGIDRSDYMEGCTTTPVVCNADVVGRELAIYGGHWLGHVGITRGFDSKQVYDQVLEVFKQQPSDEIKVSLNSFDSFKSIPGAEYWGAKFGITDKPILTDSDATKILDAGMAQMNYPFTYTVTWDYHPGGSDAQFVFNQNNQSWDRVFGITEAKFRCDTFVYYSYVAGANLHIIPEYKFPWVPKDMMAVMTSCRNTEGSICATNNLASRTRALMQTAQFESIFSAKELDFKSADAATKAYVTSNQVARQAKLNQFWLLALKYQDDPVKFGYLLDCLASLKPIELMPELIDTFKLQSNQQNKYKLLAAMIASLQFKDAIEMERAHSQVSHVITAQNFIRELLYQETDMNLQKFLVKMYSSVMPAEAARQDIARVLSMHGLQASLSSKERALLELNLAFSTPEQQRQSLPNMMAAHVTESAQDKLWNHALCFVLSGMSPAWIDESMRQSLAHTMDIHKSMLINLSPQSAQTDMPPCHWLSAYATLMTHGDNEKNQFMLSYIRNERDIFAQAYLLSQLNWQLNKQISVDDKVYYRSRFITQLNGKTLLSGSNKKIIMEGVSSVYDHK